MPEFLASLFLCHSVPVKRSSKALQITIATGALACHRLTWNSFTAKRRPSSGRIMPDHYSLPMDLTVIVRAWPEVLRSFVNTLFGSLALWSAGRLQCCGSSVRLCDYPQLTPETGSK